MKKRIFAFILILALLVSICIPVSAAGVSYLIDETGVLSDNDKAELEALAGQLSDDVGIDIAYAYTYTDTDDFEAFLADAALGSRDDQVIMVENDDWWQVYTYGKTEELISADDCHTLRDAFDSESTLYDAVYAYMNAAAEMLEERIAAQAPEESEPVDEPVEPEIVIAENNDILSYAPLRLVDDADLLDDYDESILISKLAEISERQQLDVVVVTVYSLDGKSAMEYADDYYDYNGYGFGDDRDGILLLVSMEDRDWWISTTGYGITAFTDAGIDYLSEQFLPYLSDGDYYQAFTTYAELCDDFITKAKEGEPYDSGNLPKEPFNILLSLVISLVIGFVIAFVVTTVMKGKLKSVRFQAAAGSYVKANSLRVTESRDLYLYTHTDRRERPKDNDSGGSSTHISSSGTTHGGGGGKF